MKSVGCVVTYTTHLKILQFWKPTTQCSNNVVPILKLQPPGYHVHHPTPECYNLTRLNHGRQSLKFPKKMTKYRIKKSSLGEIREARLS